MKNKEFIEEIKKLKSVADIGLLYANSGYDKERYLEIQNIALRLLSKISGNSIQALRETFPLPKDYPTAKTDIRGLVLSADKTKILLVRESADGKWSLPGGWADTGYSPKEIIIKEFKEETGLDVIPQKLLAIFDKKMHAHPPEPFYVYKMVFYCTPVALQTSKGFDILDVQYFNIHHLPELSESRILKSQIDLVYKKLMASDYETYFD